MTNAELMKAAPRGAVMASGPREPGPHPRDPGPQAPPLLAVLARRWRAFALAVCLCLGGAVAFLLLATRTYRASATIYIQQNAPRAFAEGAGGSGPMPDTFLQTQADVIRSTPVLARALEGLNYKSLRTFAGVPGNAALWMQRGPLGVDVVKRSDVITVSMDSPYPEEAAAVVDGVIAAYVAEQSQAAVRTAAGMVRVLDQEREKLMKRRAAAQEAVLAAQRERGEPTVRDGKGNLVLGRLESLSSALAAAEVATLELKSQKAATEAALASPESLHAYVEGLQFRGRDLGDREYDELRSQVVRLEGEMTTLSTRQGSNHPGVRGLRQTIENLKEQIRQKEESIAASQLTDVSARLDAALTKEQELRAALDAARARAVDLNPAAASLARQEAELREVERQCEMLDRRVAELNVNSADAGELNVRVVQPAIVPEKPVKPNKSLTLAAALLVGFVLGLGLATLREWHDARLRSPEEIPALVGVPLVGVVPQINRSLSPAERGQVLWLDSRSAVAEAYRSVRTSLYLGGARDARAVLLASPATGDGKSTTAANLAIAFAQAGERTLLLDCDLREPVQHLIFGCEPANGVATVMSGEAQLQEAIVRTAVPNLYLLPCGPVPRHPSEMLASDRFKLLLKTLGGAFDRVVIDSPALEAVADARILATAADATVLVLRVNRSFQGAGAVAAAGLNAVGANVVGAVANDVRTSVSAYRVENDPWNYAAGRRRQVLVSVGAAGEALPARSKAGELPDGGAASVGQAKPGDGHNGEGHNGNGKSHEDESAPFIGPIGLAGMGGGFSTEGVAGDPEWPAAAR
jgi:capsular exopolysaccharide synthesis family protein